MWRALLQHRRLVITAHRGPDGDGIGSALALAALLRAQGRTVQVAADGDLQERLKFLPGTERIVYETRQRLRRFDALVVLDCGSLDRTGWVGTGLPAGTRVYNLDHHEGNTAFGDLAWIEPALGSVGEMIYRLWRAAKTRMPRNAALPLYVAMISDNGSFSFSNTSPYSHLIAADLLRHGVKPDYVHDQLHNSRSPAELTLHSETIRRMKFAANGRIAWAVFPAALFRRAGTWCEESQDYVSLLRSVRGVSLAILIRDAREPGVVKVSLRSDGAANCSRLARGFGGGGHARASGCTLRMSLRQAERRIVAAAKSLFSAKPARGDA